MCYKTYTLICHMQVIFKFLNLKSTKGITFWNCGLAGEVAYIHLLDK